jgi:EH domain-containing protein 1
MPMKRENHISAMHAGLVEMVEKNLTPVALRYGYSEVPLEADIKWHPLVLVLGNYSSGKSALINEFLGADIQATGQAPTDDSFTIITYDETSAPDSPIRVAEVRDGKHLLNDPEFPFETLKQHGQRFASHFRLKKVNSQFLKTLAIIDTPGMLDSITERDRGYSYQDVVGGLAQIADLILVLFDPHKAGTIREAHTSLRETLPVRTFEDRILFVLNRIDECGSLTDLLRVYGTLCWNLSQITGRKDIPMIHLTYSPRAAKDTKNRLEQDTSYLQYLENQREELKKSVLEAPKHRLDHLATFVETHSERLSHFLEALLSYRRKLYRYRRNSILMGLLFSLLGSAAALGLLMYAGGQLSGMDSSLLVSSVTGLTAAFFLLWIILVLKFLTARFHRKQIKVLDNLTSLDNQTRKDSWQAIKDLTLQFLEKKDDKHSLRQLKKDYRVVRGVFEKGGREIRKALKELAALKPDTPITLPPGASPEATTRDKTR